MPHGLVQRELELGAIDRLLDAARGGSGGAIVVEGPVGIGKTSLLDAAIARARAHDLHVGAARGDEFERDFDFAVAHQLFEPSLRRLSDGERASLLGGGVPRRAAIVGLYALAARLAERRPLLLAVDDADRSDEASVDWLRFMLPRLDALPLALILAARRDNGVPLGFLDEAGVEALALEPLGEIATRALLRAEIGAPPDPLLARACRAATGGNPLLLRELGRAVVAAGMAPTRENAAAVGELTSPRLNRLVAARLRRLTVHERALAEALAVLGPDATLLEAGEVAGLAAPNAAAAADRLRSVSLLAPDARPRLAQPMLALAVRSGLSTAERSALHLRAAEVLDRHGAPLERMATHLLQSEPGALSWVSRGLRLAAGAALGRGDPAAAVRLLRRALAETAPGERGAVLRELGVAESRLPDVAAVEHLREAQARVTTTRDRAAVALALARTLVGGGRETESIDVLEAATSEARGHDDDLALHCEAELCAVSRFHPPRARRTAARLEELAAGGPVDPPGRRAMLACVAAETALTGGRTAEAAVLAERALAGGRLVREATCDSPVLHLACLTLVWCDRPESAGSHLDDALEDAKARGSAVGSELASACRAHARLRVGAVEEAESDARAALDASRSGGALAAPLAAGALCLSLLEQGRLAEGQAALEAVRQQAESSALGASAAILYARGRLRLEAGDALAARDDLEAAGRALEDCGVTSPALISWRSAAALANASLGDRDRAAELAREELVLARRCGSARAISEALRACARLSGSTDAVALLGEAAALLEESEARLEHAHALHELGGALRRVRRRRDAREPLHRALELAQELGATALASHARQELTLAGARPRRDAYSGRDALTPAERRTAELAAGGIGNREIARTLYVSVKTVESHLGHVYAKLGIGSRRELRRALGKDQGRTPMRD